MASAVAARYLTSCCRNCWRSHASSRGGNSRVDVMSNLGGVLWRTSRWFKEESSVHLFWDLAEPQLLVLVLASNNTLVTLSHWECQTEPPIYRETYNAFGVICTSCFQRYYRGIVTVPGHLQNNFLLLAIKNWIKKAQFSPRLAYNKIPLPEDCSSWECEWWGCGIVIVHSHPFLSCVKIVTNTM